MLPHQVNDLFRVWLRMLDPVTLHDPIELDVRSRGISPDKASK